MSAAEADAIQGSGSTDGAFTPLSPIESISENRSKEFNVSHKSSEAPDDIDPKRIGSDHGPQLDSSDGSDAHESFRKAPTTIVWNQSFDNRQELEASNTNFDNSASKKKPFHFHLRGYDDDGETDWWFASTAVPLLASALAPLANVLSIAALVTYWRMDLRDPNNPDQLLVEFSGRPYADPRWAYWLNVGSLICGFVGNIFLLANFTGRIRYIISLPVTIILWYIATGILIGITIAMNHFVPPTRPYQTYSQGFWYAVIAAVLYLVCSFLLMFNMLGYFLGHYPQRFTLNEHQRTLILQTMLFFIWLAGGGAVFSRIESRGNTESDWSFVDGLYFCDVTILTVGFGDLVLRNDLGRALIFPYTVGGIIMLGLVISSISKFAADMGQDNVVRKHFEHVRTRTLERTTMDPSQVKEDETLRHVFSSPLSMKISAPRSMHHMHHLVPGTHGAKQKPRQNSSGSGRRGSLLPPVRRRTNLREAVIHRSKKVRLLRDERERFNEMRRIQHQTQSFKKYWGLSLSVCAFALLWLLGAVVFWVAERKVQGMSYFQSLYFCYVSLLTIGYGDFAPRSNAGRSFFVVWSLIAVPTITLLINDMGSTVIESFKRGTSVTADFTVLLRKGVWNDFVQAHPKLQAFLQNRKERKARNKRMHEGLPVGDQDVSASNDDNELESKPVKVDEQADDGLEQLARQVTADEFHAPGEARLARHLSEAIRRVATDLSNVDKKYTFEEWAELTRLIRFTGSSADVALKEQEEDVIDWDWLGEESPMMANMSEPEFVMEKLCQSLARNMKRMDRKVHEGIREIERLRKQGDPNDDEELMKS